MSKLKAGIIGATGMVGQRFITLTADHPMFEIAVLAASPRSAGRKYSEVMDGKWKLSEPMPESVKDMIVMDASNIESVAEKVDFVFCAVDMNKDEIKAIEEAYAKAEIPVVSNNSANRWTVDVPMIIPEINDSHVEVIEQQKMRLGTKRGFVACKPNCSIQSYVPALNALKEFKPKEVSVCTYQAISGAGKTFKEWPEILDNIIPYIGGEEEKSEQEPLKIWGKVTANGIEKASSPKISAQCIRVPVQDGHLAAVSVNFEIKPTKEQILEAWDKYEGFPQKVGLPSAPKKFLKYMEEDNRPQTHLDRNYENGMGITVGRLREDELFQYKFVSLSHNTLRGAAGGAVLMAEMLAYKGYITKK